MIKKVMNTGKYTIRVTNPEMIPRIQEKLTLILAELTLEK